MAQWNVRIDEKLDGQLRQLCDVTDRDATWHIKRAMRDYLEQRLWEVHGTQEAIAELDRGEVATPEEMRALFEKAGVNPDDYGLAFTGAALAHEN